MNSRVSSYWYVNRGNGKGNRRNYPYTACRSRKYGWDVLVVSGRGKSRSGTSRCRARCMNGFTILGRQSSHYPGGKASNLSDGWSPSPVSHYLMLYKLYVRCRSKGAIYRNYCSQYIRRVRDGDSVNMDPRRRRNNPTRGLCRSCYPGNFKDLSRRFRRVYLFFFTFVNSTVVYYVFFKEGFLCFNQDVSRT